MRHRERARKYKHLLKKREREIGNMGQQLVDARVCLEKERERNDALENKVRDVRSSIDLEINKIREEYVV